MLQGFKQFMLRGNVLDLAVAVVMGAAFGAVVTALVKDLITPLIAAIIGKPDFSAIEFTIRGSKFPNRRLHQRVGLVHPDRGCGVLLGRPAGEQAACADAARRGCARPDHEEVP